MSYVASQSALRGRRNLLSDPVHRRHQKVIDTSTGAIVGFARWLLPDSVPGAVPTENLWPAAQVPRVSKEVELEAEREYASADWSYDHALDALDGPVLAIKHRLMAGKKFIGEWFFEVLRITPGTIAHAY
jgi:hypothetical protein